MQHETDRKSAVPAAWMVLLLLLAVPAVADESDPGNLAQSRAVPPLESIRREMDRTRGQIKNARMRLTNGVAGLGTESSDRPPTPARVCCASNVQKMRASFAEIGLRLDDVSRCYEEQGNEDAVSAAVFARQDLQSLAQAVNQFDTGTDMRAARTAVAQMTRAYNRLLETIEALGPCPPPATESDASGERSEKKKKGDG